MKEKEEKEAREKEKIKTLERLPLLYNQKHNNEEDEEMKKEALFDFSIPYYLTKDYLKEIFQNVLA